MPVKRTDVFCFCGRLSNQQFIVGLLPRKPSEEQMSALLLWAFILIGNAVAIVVLSAATAGGTSAMGSGGETFLERPRP
jgi:hypothetical protein